MKKKRNEKFLIQIVIVNISLLIGMVISTAFIISLEASIVSAQNEEATIVSKKTTAMSHPSGSSSVAAAKYQVLVPVGGKISVYNIDGKIIGDPIAGKDIDHFLIKDGGGKEIVWKDGTSTVVTDKQYSEITSQLSQGVTLQPGYSYKVPIIGTEITKFFGGHLVQGLFWSVSVVSAIQLIGGIAGFD